jgi:hypothetical protein
MFLKLANKLDQIAQRFTPPADVAAQAALGIKFRQQYNRGGGLVGLLRAHQLKNKEPLSINILQQMNRYFIRHQKHKDSVTPSGEPGNGKIAWLLWGGDAGRDWVQFILKENHEGKTNRTRWAGKNKM